MTTRSRSALTHASVSPAPRASDVTSRPSGVALASLCRSSSPCASSRDQGPVPRLRTCGSHRKLPPTLGMWVLGPPPRSGARFHAVRGSLTVHIASRLTSCSCSRPLRLQSHQWQFPPPWSPAHRGRKLWTAIPSAEARVGEAADVKLGEPSRCLSQQKILLKCS